MGVIADLIIKLGVQDSGVGRTLESAGKGASKFGSELGHVAKVAAVAGGAAGIAGLVYTLKDGYSEWTDSTKVAAQTSAAIKSTGGAAHVTSKHVDDLANSILRKSGIDDEAVKSGENMLLTFTGIRNEAGKGNDIFDQATKAVTDMDTAMTHGNSTAESLSKTSILVGKALNDPIKGATALRRVGVSLTESQQKQIAAFVKSGDTMAAQKIVLHELNKEFGGSAEALGKTLPGQIKIAREEFNNMAGDLFTKLVPTLTKVVGWVDTNWPTIERVFGAVFDGIGFAISNGIVPAMAFLISEGRKVVSWFQVNWPQIRETALRVFNAIAPSAISTFNTIRSIIQGTVTVVMALWDRFGSTIITVARNDFNAIKGIVEGALNVVRGVVNIIGGLIHGDWSRVWLGIKQVVSGTLGALGALIRGVAANAVAEMHALGSLMVDGLKAGLAKLAALPGYLVGKVVGAIAAVLGAAYSAAKGIGAAIANGVVDGVGDLAGRLAGKVKGAVSGAIHTAGSILHGSGEFMFTKHTVGHPLAQGVIEGYLEGSASLPSTIATNIANAIEAGRQKVDAARGKFSSSFGTLASIADNAFDAISGAQQTKSEKALGALQAAHDAQQAAEQMADAQAALAQAQQAGDANGVVQAQRQIDELLYEQKVAALQQQAAAERQDLDAQNAVKKMHLDAALAALQAHLTKVGATQKQAQAAILKLLHSYGIDYANVGKDMGAAWIGGLRESIAAAAKGAGAIHTVISITADSISHIKPKGKKAGGGHVSGGGGYLVGEHGPELYFPASDGRIVPNGGLAGGGGDGDIVLVVDNEVLGRASRKALTRKGTRNVSLRLSNA